MEILKKFNGTTEADLKSGGVFTSIRWEDMIPAMKQIIRFRDDEILDGFIVTDEGVKIKLSRKKGRKISSIK